MAKSKLIGAVCVLNAIMNKNIDAEKVIRVAVCKLTLILTIIQFIPHVLKEKSNLEKVVEFAGKAFENKNNEVRMQSYHVLIECCKSVEK